MTAWVGTFSAIVARRTFSFVSPVRSPNSLPACPPAIGRLERARPRIFAKLDLPDPKKPETQTPIPS